MEAMGQAVAAVIAGLPPVLGAILIIGLVLLGLAYLWRKVGEEAKRERSNAQQDRDNRLADRLASVAARMDEMRDDHKDHKELLRDMAEDISAVRLAVEVLKDRRR